MGLLGGVPYPLGGGSSSSALVASTSEPWDIKIGELKFMLAAGPENPLIRRGAEYRTQQVNFSNEPGEIALGFWWQRSQSTWHFGTGNPTFDGPGSGDPEIAVGRFADSFNVDVWTRDQVSLLGDTERIQVPPTNTSPVTFQQATVLGTPYLYWACGDSNLYQWNGTTVTSLTGGGAPYNWSSVNGVTTDGSLVWILDDTANKIWAYGDFDGDGDVEGTELYTGTPPAPASATDPTAIIRYVKQRIIAAYNDELYELPLPATPVDPMPSPFFTHPKSDWVWTDVVEGPGAIYASGFAGSSSAVYKFELDTSGEVPVLTKGIIALETPPGETIHKMLPYIGSFIVLGTSAGVRVCSFNGTDIALAPLTIENLEPTHPVRGLTAWGNFVYATYTDNTNGHGLARIDVGQEVDAGRYAWARDLQANLSATEFDQPDATATAAMRVGNLQGRLVFSLRGASGSQAGTYAQSLTRLAPSGSLTSGRMLFGTSEKKNFLRAQLAATGTGTVTLSTGVNSATAPVPQTTIDTAQLNEVDITLSDLSGSTLTLGLALTRDASDSTLGPTVQAISAKALPAQSRERQWILPLRAYDAVEDQTGSAHYQSAAEVIDSLEQYVRTQEPVLLQTFFGDPERDWRTVTVHVEDVEYRQVQSEAGWGGVLTVSVRTIEG